ncbi:MAG: EamA family transporter [Actinomycetes bacterium]
MTSLAMMTSGARLGYGLVIVSAVCAAANGVVARLIIEAGVTAKELAALRIYGATIVLFFAVFPHLRRLRRREVIQLVGFAFVGFVLGQGMYFQAIARLNIALVLTIVFTAPIIVGVYQRVRKGERLPRYAYVAIVVAVAGLAVAVLGAGGIGSVSVAGLVFASCTMLAYVATVIMAGHLDTTMPPLARTGVAFLIASLVWAVILPPWRLPYHLLSHTAHFDGVYAFSFPVWTGILFVAVVDSAVLYTCFFAGTKRIGAGASSVVGMIEPVLGAVLAWLLLAQSLTPLQTLGITAALGGIIVVEQARMKSTTTRL